VTTQVAASTPLLSVDGLAVDYRGRERKAGVKRVLHDVSFGVSPGETLALVGESGSGKSTIGRSLVGLAPVAAGRIEYAGTDITQANRRQRRALAKDIQMIFQNPYGSLNPALTVGDVLAEPLTAVLGLSKRDARERVRGLLDRVHLPADAASRYASHFSGGQRQRIAIARALALEPALIVCDEPTSALDVTTQASILELLQELQQRTGTSYLFITHDLAVVRRFADRVIVLREGRIVEEGTTAQVCDRPTDPYAQRLVAAAPVPDPVKQRERRERRLAATDTSAPATLAR
jgi:peptide/nickel transport system ATP-binding protein